MTPTISVIIPTIGRETLARALDSIIPQLLEGDEIQLVHDGSTPIEGLPECVKQSVLPGVGAYKGNPARDQGIALASGTHLMFCDDDDSFKPDALKTARKIAKKFPTTPTIFRVQFGEEFIFNTRLFAAGNVSGIGFLVPRDERIPGWQRYNSQCEIADFLWMQGIAEALGTEPVFNEAVVATAGA